MRTNILPPSPRVERTLRITRQFIKKASISKLPVDPFQIFAIYEWALFSCQEVEGIKGKSDPLNIRKHGVDAKTIRDRDTGTYLTVYDENNLQGRIRWTLAHEIGHIVLGHLTDYNKTCLHRSQLSNEEYKVLEREANIFAAELLAPLAILKILDISTSDEIIYYCQISKEAADYREKEIRWHGDKKIYCEANHFYGMQFRDYISLISQSVGEIKMESKLVSVSVDENRRFLECPRCKNNKFSEEAKYCYMCGLHLFNTCSNAPDLEASDYCNHINIGDARYCEMCGAPTYLYNLGLLLSWEETIKLQKENDNVKASFSQKPLSVLRS